MAFPLVIPVFIPHSGCPHQCAFCNQAIITSQKKKLPDPKEMDATIGQYLAYKGNRSRVELAFFGGNFLGLPDPDIIRLLERVRPYIEKGTIHGIRCSTRPDTITEHILDLIAPYGVSLVELGVQSMTDSVLSEAHRGHTRFHTRQAITLLKARKLQVGVQVMAGLPGDTESQLLDSTRQIAALGPDVARIYPLMVLEGSLLSQWYRQGSYIPLTLDQAVLLVKKMYKIFDRARVRVIRMGLQASEMMEDRDQVLAGPWHPAFGHLVLSELVYDQVCEKLCAFQATSGASKILIRVHPRFESRLRGDKNHTLARLEKDHPGICFTIKRDDTLLPAEVSISQGPAGG